MCRKKCYPLIIMMFILLFFCSVDVYAQSVESVTESYTKKIELQRYIQNDGGYYLQVQDTFFTDTEALELLESESVEQVLREQMVLAFEQIDTLEEMDMDSLNVDFKELEAVPNESGYPVTISSDSNQGNLQIHAFIYVVSTRQEKTVIQEQEAQEGTSQEIIQEEGSPLGKWQLFMQTHTFTVVMVAAVVTTLTFGISIYRDVMTIWEFYRKRKKG